MKSYVATFVLLHMPIEVIDELLRANAPGVHFVSFPFYYKGQNLTIFFPCYEKKFSAMNKHQHCDSKVLAVIASSIR